MSRHSVAIVEDHLLLAETLAETLGRRGVGARVVDAEAVLAAVVDRAVDVVLLDLDLGGRGDGLELITPLTVAGAGVLIVSGSTDELTIGRALELGAIGFRSKSDGFDALVEATLTALEAPHRLAAERAGRLAALAGRRAAQDQLDAPYRDLTDRERGTLRALTDGQSVSEIARHWVVSETTVRSHVRGVLHKLGVRSQLAAVARAHEHGWVQPRG